MTKRIVQIIPTLDQGGAEKQLALLATGLPRDRFDVHVCALTRLGPWESVLQDAGLPVECIGKQRKFDPSAYRRLKQYLTKRQPDLVHTWLFAANTYGRRAARATGRPKLVAGERCVDQWKSWHHFVIDRYLAKRTDRIVANSQGVKEFYVEQGIDEQKIVVIPNGIDVAHYRDDTSSTVGEAARQTDEPRHSIRAELNLPETTHLIGAVGRLWPQKRFKDLIWSADLIKCVREDTHILIIGDGPQRLALEKYAEQVEILDKVHFLGHRSDTNQIIPQLTLLWSGSEFEGLSNVVMEAMASHVPVIATDISGHRDLIEHDETGALVPVGDRASFAKWATFLLDHEDKAKRLAGNAYQRISTEFAIEKMVEKHVDLYDDLLG